MYYYIIDIGVEPPDDMKRPMVMYEVQVNLQETVDQVVRRIHGTCWSEYKNHIVIAVEAPGHTRVPKLFGVEYSLITKSNSGHTLLYS